MRGDNLIKTGEEAGRRDWGAKGQKKRGVDRPRPTWHEVPRTAALKLLRGDIGASGGSGAYLLRAEAEVGSTYPGD